MEKIIIYGIGANCKVLLNNVDLSQFEILAFIDKYRYGQTYCNKPVLSLEEIKNTSFDKIFITPKNSIEILNELTDKFNINKNLIETPLCINLKYILPQIEPFKYIIFLDSSDYICYLYKNIGKRENHKIVGILETEEEWEILPQKNNDEKLFIFGSYHMFNASFFKYFKLRYPLSKKVMIFYDTFNGELGYFNIIPNFLDTFKYIKNNFNSIFTYHSKEAQKYDIEFLPQIYPTPNLDEYTSVNEETDVIFIGQAKDRLNLLHDVYYKLSKNGLKCKFWIIGVPEEYQINSEGLIYNTPMNYTDYLTELKKSKCILEICKKGDETSFRYAEAIVYHKKLLLNDPTVYNKKYAFKENIQVFTNADDIDLNWFKISDKEYTYNEEYSPEQFIESLKKRFNV